MSKQKTKVVATLAERIAMHTVAIARSTPIKDNEATRLWNEGESFASIANEVSPRLNADHVRSTCRAMNITIEDQKAIPLPDRLAPLEDRISRLEKWAKHMDESFS